MGLARMIAEMSALIQTTELIFNENKPIWLALSAILMLSLLLIDLRGSCGFPRSLFDLPTCA